MKIIRCFLIFFIFCDLACFAQKKVMIIPIGEDTTALEYKWLGSDSRVLTSMNVVYRKPDGFKELPSVTECFKENVKFEEAFTCVSHLLQSEDDQFMAFMQTHRLFTKSEIVEMRRLSDSFDPDNIFTGNMKYIIKVFFGNEKADNWEELVDFYSTEEAHKKFNADSAMKLSISLAPEDYYKHDYKYVDVLFFQKKERGFISFFCFYTDKARGNFDHYWEKIEKAFCYED